ncbi:hypothetical protein [Methylobacterium sp. A54F]
MPTITLPDSAAPAQAAGSPYVVGRDAEGHWVAVAAHGLCGGLFASREAAIRFAAAEGGCPAAAIRLAAGPVRLVL